jgi:tRNA-specific 2-thiouridylase
MMKELNSLGLPGAPKDCRVVVAMSGGVDSSVVAGLLKEEGYDVVGITLQLYDQGLALGKKGACCAGQDIYDARRVADRLGMPHYVLDYENNFRQSVIDDFVETYLAGETPIPCIRCNQRVKFKDLLSTARELGAQAMATGHYVRRVVGKDGPQLHRAADVTRDQSYFLFTTTREQLDFLRFPLGEIQDKAATRAIAERLRLEVAQKPDSQDICFVPDGRYAGVIEKMRPGAVEPGAIVHIDGRVLGHHDGIIHYTVGQRKGLALTDPHHPGLPLFVVKLDAEKRQVIVGPRASLACDAIRLREMNWLMAPPAPGTAIDAMVKVRSMSEPVAATIHSAADGDWPRVVFHDPQLGVAPGQACVIYQGARVLGGGWIMRDLSAEKSAPSHHQAA